MDTISGGIIPTGGSVKLTIDDDKVGYVILPNKTVLATVTGVIDYTYTGSEGNLTYYIPKNADNLSIANSSVKGSIIYNGDTLLNCDNCTQLTSIIALNTKAVYASGASLTAKSIGDMLLNAAREGFLICDYSFTGGNNALESQVNTYLESIGSFYETLYTILVLDNGGSILIDTV